MPGNVGTTMLQLFGGDRSETGTARAGANALGIASAASESVAAYTRSRGRQTAALMNAAAADAEAESTRAVGHGDAAKRTAAGDRQRGTVRAQIAGRGFTVGTGTAGDVEDATDMVTALDAMTIRENTNKKVTAKRLEAGGYRLQAASENPTGELIGTAIGGASRVHSRWGGEG